MFLDDQFYELLQYTIDATFEETNEAVREIHRIVIDHIKEHVIDKKLGDTDLIIVCKRVDKQYRRAVDKLHNEGHRQFNPELMVKLFWTLHPEIAELIWTPITE